MLIGLRSCVAALALSSCLAGPVLADRAFDEAAIRALKSETWPSIYGESDADALDAFLADDFVVIAGGAVTPKAEEVSWLRETGYSQPEDFRYEVEDVIFITSDAAIVYGRGLSTRETADGQPCRHSYWSSNTMRREADGWRPVSSHVSDVSCEPLAP